MEEHKTRQKPDAKLWAVAVVLGLLILISGIQAFELADLKEKVSTEAGTLTLSTSAASSAGSGSSGSSLQENIQNLPDMVGGC